jgi:8-oxo-dGTP pyrophosphatase MutT (NUDIX family)
MSSILPFTFTGVTFAAMSEMNEIVAAGGVVIDTTRANSPVVLLVHRPDYDDWSFPKGKLDPGEMIEQAALREVKEETGLDCRIVRGLLQVRYSYQNRGGRRRLKVVHYFLMEPVAGRITVNLHEVDAAQWFEVGEAAGKLSYGHDRELLASVFGPVRDKE